VSLVNRSICLCRCLLLVVLSVFLFLQPTGGIYSNPSRQNNRSINGDNFVYLPVVLQNYPWVSPFSVESNEKIAGTLLDRAEELGPGWVRLHRISWRNIQPTEDPVYDWSSLSDFEDELRALRGAGITPIAIVHHSPRWATIEPTSCGAVRTDKFQAFANFMSVLVSRYKQPEFDVHYWELGNEPDVDPSLVNTDNVFGCWGDIDDPYYGGRHYGEMLKVVGPAIKAADPDAKILVGGLLLNKPVTLDPGTNKPALFLKGILQAGAAPYFDIVPYHAYPSYTGQQIDYDVDDGPWQSWGGWTLGKARFLRQIMDEYGVDKPLFLNETALGCNPDYYSCEPPPAQFYEAQADYLARTFTRALSEDIGGLTWYTLNGPGWREGGLLDNSYNPRPAYVAYKHLITRLAYSTYAGTADYGSAIEAYSFTKKPQRVHVAWSKDATSDIVQVPQSDLIQAYDRDGNAISPTPVGDNYRFTVGLSPVYLVLNR
jgi:hypothetical protein